jgi:hypothetical protein
MAKRKQFDVKSPKAKALIDEIVHGTFVKEGTMVAFPLCFPGASVPIAADESRITALDVDADGIVYGGTSGRRAHLFVGMLHGVTGAVLDMGAVEGADQCAAVCCGKTHFVAFLNGPGGGRIVSRKLQPLPFDLIQEWGFTREPFAERGEVAKGERILHAVTDARKEQAVGVTEKHVFRVDIAKGKTSVIGEAAGSGRVVRGAAGSIFGRDGADALWRYDLQSGAVTRGAVKLPKGKWDATPLLWARDPVDGRLYTADAAGTLFGFVEKKGFSGPLGTAPVAPVNAMAVTNDGRLFGQCGEGIGRLFCLDPRNETVSDLGVATSVLERRRYGYCFGDAVTGRDGEIVFGENDDLGHLWLYFPRIGNQR